MSSIEAAEVEALAGDLSRAEAELRSGYDTLRRIGAGAYVPTWAALLGRVICTQERDEEALGFTRISEELSGADDITAQVPWRAARARIYARRGRAEEAERLGREAVAQAERTDWLNLQAETLRDLAAVLLLSGKLIDARDALRRALGLWEEKGNLASTARVRALVHRLEASRKP
jgi:tetratricopeptide (TPR) repeat protein